MLGFDTFIHSQRKPLRKWKGKYACPLSISYYLFFMIGFCGTYKMFVPSFFNKFCKIIPIRLSVLNFINTLYDCKCSQTPFN